MKKKAITFLIFSILPINAFSSSVLFMGDSHSVGHFGLKLDKLLRTEFNQVSTIASCGSVAKWFFNGRKTKCGYFFKDQNGRRQSGKSKETPLIKNITQKLDPDVIIIALGANYTHSSDEFMRRDIRNLLDHTEIFSKKCLWVGPPDTRKMPERLPRLYRIINEVVKGRCKIFESHKVTKYPSKGSDGLHYWGTEGKSQAYGWAQKVFDEVKTQFIY